MAVDSSRIRIKDWSMYDFCSIDKMKNVPYSMRVKDGLVEYPDKQLGHEALGIQVLSIILSEILGSCREHKL